MKVLYSFITALALLLYPLCSFAETVAQPQEEQDDTNTQNVRPTRPSSNNVSRPSRPNSSNVSRPSNNTRPNVSRPNNNHRPDNARPGNHNGYRPSNVNRPPNNHRPSTSTRPTHYSNTHVVHTTRPHSRVYYVTRRTYAPHYSSVVVYDRPMTVEYVAPAEYEESVESTVVEDTSTVDLDYNKTFGLGFTGVIATNSAIGNLEPHSSGGFGFYLKYRPVRYFSIEFTNDYLFGTLKYTDGDRQSYTKIPLALGARIHFLDYGNVDTYAALAGSLSVISYLDDYSYRRHTYISKHGYQYGGQFGIGFDYITGIFEIGLDVRYTIESVPDYIPYYVSNEDDKIIHGGLFTLSIGLAL